MGDHPGPADIKEMTMKGNLERRISRLEAILKEEQKPIVLKVHSVTVGQPPKIKQEKDHGPVDKRRNT
jgi:hypothetical protein